MPLIGEINRFYRALLSREGSPLSFVVGSCALFATSTVCVHACRPEGLPEELQTAMSAGRHMGEVQYSYGSFLFYQLLEGV